MKLLNRWLAWVLIGIVSAAGLPASEDERARAVELYSRGDFASARVLLEQLDASGEADGALLYRLAYCQRVGGDTASASATQQRALESLEREVADSGDIEVPFYLVNTYQNVGREADVRRVAAETVARIESGALNVPERGIDMFRVGKLYADQGLEKQAVEWYSRSVDALEAEGGSSGAYLRWASRYIAERAFRAKDYEAAQRHYTVLFDQGEGSADDLDRLAVARTRMGLYEEAAQAWKQAELLGPADPNRARYCYNLARMAADLVALPGAEPAGQPWAELTKTDLEQLMSDQAAVVKQAQAEAQEAESLTKQQRIAIKTRIEDAKPVFVAAALEYASRGYSIRETAFFGGYAPLIFRKAAWRVGRKATDTQASEE